MKSFFEPAIVDLLEKVKEQKDELAKKGSKIDVSETLTISLLPCLKMYLR